VLFRSGASLSITSSLCTYTKIGRMVQLQGQIVYPTTSNGSNALIGGMPFACSATLYTQVTPAILSGTITSLTIILGSGTPFTTIIPRTQLTNTTYTNSQMSGTIFNFTACYTAA